MLVRLAGVAHHAILIPTAFFTYAMAAIDPLAAGVIAVGGVGIWLHAHAHTHPVQVTPTRTATTQPAGQPAVPPARG